MAQELLMHRLAPIDEHLLSCIACRNIADQPLLLRCLHSCCGRCADSTAAAEGSNSVRCPTCDVLTDMSAAKHHNGFINELVRRFTALKDADKCSLCREDGSHDEPADVWCIQCKRSLCSACLPGHSRYNRSHVTIALAQITSWNELLQAEVQQKQCLQHSKPLDLLCFDCKQAKCPDCTRLCEGFGHSAPRNLKGSKAETYLKEARESIQHLSEQVHGKSEQLLQIKNLVKDIQSARAMHLDELKTKKKYAVDALSNAFDDSAILLKDCYDQLEGNAAALQSLAEQLHQSVQHASTYVSCIADLSGDPDLLDQHTTVLSRLEVLAKQLDVYIAIPDAEKLVTLSGSLPGDLDKVVASWMGTPKLTTEYLGQVLAEHIALMDDARACNIAADQPVLLFGPACSSFQSPVHCTDLSITSEGHLLLAASEHGLKEYSDSGHELSSWRPAKLSDGENDEVVAVRSLQDGRAAVGVYYSQLVLLLRRSSSDAPAKATASAAAAEDLQWLEDRRVTLLQSPPYSLSVHGDLLAVIESNGPLPCADLLMLQLSSGQLLYRSRYQYDIISVAVTAAAVVTASYSQVKQDDGRELQVVDSCSHLGDIQWRHEVSSEDEVCGVCAAGGLVYVAVQGVLGGSEDCVMVLSAERGLFLGEVITWSSHGLELPVCLSVDRGPRTVLAVLGCDATSEEWKHVTVHPASSDAAGSC